MKVDRVRELIQNHSEEQLRTIIAELYKALPKAVREKGEIDRLIESPDERPSKSSARKIKEPTLDSIDFEIERFIEDAGQGIYFRQRKRLSKWRFRAKEYYDALTAIENLENDPGRAATLLEGMYRVFCRGCEIYLFSGLDPFTSVRVSQSEFIGAVFGAKALSMSPSEFVKFGIDLLLLSGHSHDTTTNDLIEVFQRYLKTPDMREMAIAECEKRVVLPVKGSSSSKNKNGELAEIYFFTCAALVEYDRAIEFYKKYADKAWDLEIQLYCLLELLQRFGQKQIWIREFEAAKKSRIEPREQTQKLYRYLSDHGEFPKDHSYLYPEVDARWREPLTR